MICAKKEVVFLQRHAALVSEGWRAKEYTFFFSRFRRRNTIPIKSSIFAEKK